eukprot:scaffold36917_cov33-Tisochrysis_lutea.AAC.1
MAALLSRPPSGWASLRGGTTTSWWWCCERGCLTCGSPCRYESKRRKRRETQREGAKRVREGERERR